MKSVILNKEKLTGFNVNATAPVGAIIMWASDNLPVGWLKCDHTELKIADYPKLYDRLKDIPQCQSENEGYFYTPDFRDREPQGANGNIGELIEAGLPNIEGYLMSSTYNNSEQVNYNNEMFSGAIYPTTEKNGYVKNGNYDGNGNAVFKLDASRSSEIYGNSDTVQPPAFAIHFIIKATQTSDNLDEIIDDSKTDIGHTWSGKKISDEIESANTYSTEEKVVGTWIDGKPIYRKVFTFPSYSLGGTITINHNISDFKFSTKLEYFFTYANYTYNQWDSMTIKKCNSQFMEFYSSGLSVTDFTIILEYTKTTD